MPEAPETPETRITVVATTAFDGGAERYIARLYKGLAARGRSVRLIGSLEPWPPGELDRVQALFGPKWSLRTLPGGLLRIRRERRALERSVSASAAPREIFHLHFKREQVAFSKLLAGHGRVFWTEHGLFPRGPFGILILPFYRAAARHVESIACVSDIVAADIRRRIGDRCPVLVIPNSVDTVRLQPPDVGRVEAARARWGFGEGPVAVFAGRLEAAKRPGLAVAAAETGGFSLLVAGYGPLNERLQQSLVGTGIRVPGQLADAEEIFECADVHLFTSNGAGEGFPTVLLEAAALGIPSVIADDSGFGEFALASGGAVAPPTPQGFAAAVQEIYADPGRKVLARRWSERYDTQGWIDEHLRWFLG
ncbi:glycosyltransferase involved in cell wall biosynthesis [Cryobacterium sp. MP_M5]|uniref:glycosyltransferase family 4 protein n=1 Tax=unclassified Cryobacterium TaxID=2649013 RepID=UPI001A2AAAAA|nr:MULTISPECIES: glycosyltransferase family 4 protein [unclassified Cryobacterium]MBG6057003.1 glycosyltransferase involved in cell wall biosynthesis [Cryobacterium sp. MP_M3]MEC5175202.1 glycosyltransferase involved in cell wall biosynthesis [Cryobacterium sp. MP_M5]